LNVKLNNEKEESKRNISLLSKHKISSVTNMTEQCFCENAGKCKEIISAKQIMQTAINYELLKTNPST